MKKKEIMKKEILQSGLYQNSKGNSETTNNLYPSNITTDEINSYDLSWFIGEIMVIEELKSFRAVIPLLLREKILGFDTETKPSFRKGMKNKVSLIQLSTDNMACLFRINKLGFPDELADILANPEIIKTGVALHDDIRFLKKLNSLFLTVLLIFRIMLRDLELRVPDLRN
jgi:hypothetical protein